VETGQRIRRDPGFPPLDHIAVVIVMRRLYQLDDKPAVPQNATFPHGVAASLPCGMPAKKGQAACGTRAEEATDVRRVHPDGNCGEQGTNPAAARRARTS